MTSLLSARASFAVTPLNVSQQASVFIPLLLGIRYYGPDPGSSFNVRPFLSASVGTYFGLLEENNSLLLQQAHTETTFGGRFRVGIDFFLRIISNWVPMWVIILWQILRILLRQGRITTERDFTLGVGYIF